MAAVTYTVEGVLAAWNADTEYGASFRAMTTDEQIAEVVVLNKGAIKGMKGIIKSKLLITHYKSWWLKNYAPIFLRVVSCPRPCSTALRKVLL